MNPFEMVVIIVAVTVCAGIIKHWISAQSEQPEVDQDKEVLHQKVQQLEERVKVLESIVTDKKFSLNQEFDALKREAS